MTTSLSVGWCIRVLKVKRMNLAEKPVKRATRIAVGIGRAARLPPT